VNHKILETKLKIFDKKINKWCNVFLYDIISIIRAIQVWQLFIWGINELNVLSYYYNEVLKSFFKILKITLIINLQILLY
jgi:hypothetical protein